MDIWWCIYLYYIIFYYILLYYILLYYILLYYIILCGIVWYCMVLYGHVIYIYICEILSYGLWFFFQKWPLHLCFPASPFLSPRSLAMIPLMKVGFPFSAAPHRQSALGECVYKCDNKQLKTSKCINCDENWHVIVQAIQSCKRKTWKHGNQHILTQIVVHKMLIWSQIIYKQLYSL